MKNSFCTVDHLNKLFQLPLFESVYQAHTIHRSNFDPLKIEACALLSIKTGACPEDCAYCPQSGHYKTNIIKEKLLDITKVIQKAKLAKSSGATRFCMGAAWRSPPKKDFHKILEMIKSVKLLGLEVCVTFGKLERDQIKQLKLAGLDYYNHNLDTSPQYYKNIITTRSYQDRLETIQILIDEGLKLCCGGTRGMGETRLDRINFLLQVSSLTSKPDSIPINKLIPIKGTPLEHSQSIDNIELIKTIAVTRIIFPKSVIRLSAGREQMSEELQAWCFMAGANSIFYGDILLTAKNSPLKRDNLLLKKLGLQKANKPLSKSKYGDT